MDVPLAATSNQVMAVSGVHMASPITGDQGDLGLRKPEKLWVTRGGDEGHPGHRSGHHGDDRCGHEYPRCRARQRGPRVPPDLPQAGWSSMIPTRFGRRYSRVSVRYFARDCASLPISPVSASRTSETALLWERRTGKPLGNAIVWQCRRTAAFCDGLHKGRRADGP